jgi:uncharacterized repeat protein (TIGR03803 family)
MKVFLSATVVVLACSFALGQQYKVLWSFGGEPNDGSVPVSNLVSDEPGNLYGTTEFGGVNNGGTVFELSPGSEGTWTESVLYNFCTDTSNGLCNDGQYPVAGLIFDEAGNLYGTTTYGGAGLCGSSCGTVFELSPPASPGGAWTEAVLYSFCAGSNLECQDGSDPADQLIFDTSGNLYGTTSSGGTGNGGYGSVFELSPGASGWTLTTLYDFCMNGHARICPDGAMPEAGLAFDKSGNLYGTTELGGAKNSQGAGTVYELSPGAGSWTQTVVLALSPSGRGLTIPMGTVSFDPIGNLYSTASEGFPGGGVFELRPKTRTERHFLFDVNNGSGPVAGVIVDSKRRAIYGTTGGGGSGQGGTVFTINASGQETVLYNFCQEANCADGQCPYASVIEDEARNLYGTTKLGGSQSGDCGSDGCGVVFEIVQSSR